MKVLIAEDTLILQEVVSEYMDCLGYDFDIASNGQEAVNLAKAKEGEYDICLMDVDMPVMNSYLECQNYFTPKSCRSLSASLSINSPSRFQSFS